MASSPKIATKRKRKGVTPVSKVRDEHGRFVPKTPVQEFIETLANTNKLQSVKDQGGFQLSDLAKMKYEHIPHMLNPKILDAALRKHVDLQHDLLQSVEKQNFINRKTYTVLTGANRQMEANHEQLNNLFGVEMGNLQPTNVPQAGGLTHPEWMTKIAGQLKNPQEKLQGQLSKIPAPHVQLQTQLLKALLVQQQRQLAFTKSSPFGLAVAQNVKESQATPFGKLVKQDLEKPTKQVKPVKEKPVPKEKPPKPEKVVKPKAVKAPKAIPLTWERKIFDQDHQDAADRRKEAEETGGSSLLASIGGLVVLKKLFGVGKNVASSVGHGLVGAASSLTGMATAGVGATAGVIAAAKHGFNIEQNLDKDAAKHGFKPVQEPGGFEGSTLTYKNDKGETKSPAEMRKHIESTLPDVVVTAKKPEIQKRQFKEIRPSYIPLPKGTQTGTGVSGDMPEEFSGASGGGSYGGGSNRGQNTEPPVPYEPGKLLTDMNINPEQYNAFKESVASIESGGKYGIMGGSSGRFAGRYQMGGNEITETAARLGVPRPSTQEFLNNPQMQEQFFEAYTAGHHGQLMNNPKYALKSPEEQLKTLGYAHNQGAGGASSYLNSGRAGSDAFGTSGTVYSSAIGKNLDKLRNTPTAALQGPTASTTGQAVAQATDQKNRLQDAKNTPIIAPTINAPTNVMPQRQKETGGNIAPPVRNDDPTFLQALRGDFKNA